MNELPTIKAELNRKTVEFLEQKCYESDHEQITKADLGIVAHAAWTITAGLVDNDISALAAELADRSTKTPMKRSFVGKGEVLAFVWQPGASGFALTRRNATTLEKTSTATRTEPGEQQNTLDRLFKALKTQYVEI